jgi:hypothetical protein
MFLAGAVGVVAVAMLLPANALANCANPGQATIVSCGTGAEVIDDVYEGEMFGTFWIMGSGNDAADTGLDAGVWGSPNPSVPGVSGPDGHWLENFFIPGNRCLTWDWSGPNTDGCPGTGTLFMVVSDGENRAFVASMAAAGAAGQIEFDMGRVTNGAPGPVFGGAAGLTLGRAVHVISSSTSAGDVTVDVAALAVPVYDETGGARALPGSVRLRGNNGGTVDQAGPGTHSIVVDQDSDLCWQIVDGSKTATVGCVRVGGLTPSQQLQNAKAALGRGQINFSWDVSAQFDVLGFNIIQKNASKGTERKVNTALIPISGMNDAQAASYRFSVGRNELRATRGGFEIELVRLNGETSRTPAPLR